MRVLLAIAVLAACGPARRDPPPVAPVAEAPDPGRALLDRALAAKGGRDRLQAVKALRIAGTIKVTTAGKTYEGDVERWLAPPSRIRLDATVAGTTYTTVVDGAHGFQRTGGEIQPVPDEAIAAFQDGYWRDRELILLRHLEPGTVVGPAGTEAVDGTTYDAVTIGRADGSAETRILLDHATHLIVRLVFTDHGSTSYEEYGDYREVEGIQFAFRQRTDGDAFDVSIATIEVNPTLPASLFDP